ncbi:MAG: class I SAM-dependent methyltransferase [Phycisphaerae bacterium]|nr:class I SAM-dependent methyltransferase [Phycisphaerae bacterium]
MSEAPYIRLWDEDSRFNAIWSEVKDQTLLPKESGFSLYQWCRYSLALEGDVAEVGVYRGGSARLLANTLRGSGKTLHLFDTFTGLPPSDPKRDIYQEGHFGDTTEDEIARYLADMAYVRIYSGLFPKTGYVIASTRFCLVHVDVDIYRSVKDCCEFFYPLLVRGGVIVFDDYGFVKTPGARQAVDEFFSTQIEAPCYLPTGQAMVVRLTQDNSESTGMRQMP